MVFGFGVLFVVYGVGSGGSGGMVGWVVIVLVVGDRVGVGDWGRDVI